MQLVIENLSIGAKTQKRCEQDLCFFIFSHLDVV